MATPRIRKKKQAKRKQRTTVKAARAAKAAAGPPQPLSPAYLKSADVTDLKKAHWAVLDMRSVNPQTRRRIELTESRLKLDATIAKLMDSKEEGRNLEACRIYCQVQKIDDERARDDDDREMLLRTTVIETENARRVGEMQLQLDGGAKPSIGETVEDMASFRDAMDEIAQRAAERVYEEKAAGKTTGKAHGT